MADIPRRAVTRGAKLASLPLGIAGRGALGVGKRIGGKPAAAVTAELQARTAEQLFQVLGQLKGGAMKFGQAMSVFEAALPEDVAGPYRAALTKLQEAAPALPAATVHAVLAEQLGEDWRAQFQQFDDQPAAAASIGQVHKAVWHDGREVAVKIQYPGAGKALLGDLRQLSRLARVFSSLAPGLDLKPLLAELQERVAEELDYRLEAESQETFAVAYDGDPDIAIPHVVAGADKVLVTTWMEGTSLAAVIREGSQERPRPRRRACWRSSCSPGRCWPGCCTPTRTRATSGCCPTAGSASSTSARSTGCRTGLPSRSAGSPGWRSRAEPTRCWPSLRAEGFVKPSIEVDAERVLDYIRADAGADRRGRVPVHPRVAAARGDPGGRPALAGQPARPAAEPAAALPADPPGHDRHHRRALPAQRRGALPRPDGDLAARLRAGRSSPLSLPPGLVQLPLDRPDVVAACTARRATARRAR